MSAGELRLTMNVSEKKILVSALEETKEMAVGFMTTCTVGLHILVGSRKATVGLGIGGNPCSKRVPLKLSRTELFSCTILMDYPRSTINSNLLTYFMEQSH